MLVQNKSSCKYRKINFLIASWFRAIPQWITRSVVNDWWRAVMLFNKLWLPDADLNANGIQLHIFRSFWQLQKRSVQNLHFIFFSFLFTFWHSYQFKYFHSYLKCLFIIQFFCHFWFSVCWLFSLPKSLRKFQNNNSIEKKTHEIALPHEVVFKSDTPLNTFKVGKRI